VSLGSWETVEVELDDGIAWVVLNRPEKRNAMNPTLNAEMVEVLLELDAADDAGVLVLTASRSLQAWTCRSTSEKSTDNRSACSGVFGATRTTGSGGCCARTRSRRSRW
jgi:1,4-dihydroxy-2-naphthoyl-CoA synthase